MFTVRVISEQHETEYNTICARYRKDVEDNVIECFDVPGSEDEIEEFNIDGNPYTHCYVMNPEGNTIDKMLSPI